MKKVKMAEVRKMASSMGVKYTTKSNMTQLINGIQSQEGNVACFNNKVRDMRCPIEDCLWAGNCKNFVY